MLGKGGRGRRSNRSIGCTWKGCIVQAAGSRIIHGRSKGVAGGQWMDTNERRKREGVELLVERGPGSYISRIVWTSVC